MKLEIFRVAKQSRAGTTSEEVSADDMDDELLKVSEGLRALGA
jgi:hypothetical protein